MGGERSTVSLEGLMGSRAVMGLARGAGRALSPGAARNVGKRLARIAAGRKDSALVRAIRLNQWVASGMSLTADELDRAAQEVLHNAVVTQYELLRNYRDPKAVLALVDVDPSMEGLLSRAEGTDEGTIVVGTHMGNFDLGNHALGHLGFRAQVLSVPDPGGGYRWQNEQRESAGLELTPVSKDALVAATKRLREGGAVGTGIDRPIEAHKYLPRFFGHPAPVPVTHVRLALKTGAPVFVVSARRREDGIYRLRVSDPLYLESTGDLHADTIAGAERVLALGERDILEDPRQWLMFYPVWPDLLDEVP